MKSGIRLKDIFIIGSLKGKSIIHCSCVTFPDGNRRLIVVSSSDIGTISIINPKDCEIEKSINRKRIYSAEIINDSLPDGIPMIVHCELLGGDQNRIINFIRHHKENGKICVRNAFTLEEISSYQILGVNEMSNFLLFKDKNILRIVVSDLNISSGSLKCLQIGDRKYINIIISKKRLNYISAICVLQKRSDVIVVCRRSSYSDSTTSTSFIFFSWIKKGIVNFDVIQEINNQCYLSRVRILETFVDPQSNRDRVICIVESGTIVIIGFEENAIIQFVGLPPSPRTDYSFFSSLKINETSFIICGKSNSFYPFKSLDKRCENYDILFSFETFGRKDIEEESSMLIHQFGGQELEEKEIVREYNLELKTRDLEYYPNKILEIVQSSSSSDNDKKKKIQMYLDKIDCGFRKKIEGVFMGSRISKLCWEEEFEGGMFFRVFDGGVLLKYEIPNCSRGKGNKLIEWKNDCIQRIQFLFELEFLSFPILMKDSTSIFSSKCFLIQ